MEWRWWLPRARRISRAWIILTWNGRQGEDTTRTPVGVEHYQEALEGLPLDRKYVLG